MLLFADVRLLLQLMTDILTGDELVSDAYDVSTHTALLASLPSPR